jgi:acetate kinase
MDKKYLIVNTGSASKKYALYSGLPGQGETEVFRAHFEKEDGNFVVTVKTETEEKMNVTDKDYQSSVEYVLNLLKTKKLIEEARNIDMVGLRVVAPGMYFLENKIIDEEYSNNLQKAKEEAPLHIAPVISELEQLQNDLPCTPVFGVSDSAFHKTMPERSKRYTLPEDVASKFGIYRYGYHGISMRSVLSKVKDMAGELPARIIICHLGGGSTVSAIENGMSIDTSMGFTPLEGLPMATRIGNIDAGAVIYLAQKMGKSLEELETYFNSNCGLLGLSGKSSDVRELIELEKNGDAGAKFALESFAYHIKKYIGAYMAALGGLDMLVFAGTIGERSFIMRNRICNGLQNLGIVLDADTNNANVSQDGFINSENSAVKIAVVTTDEMKEIAKETINI